MDKPVANAIIAAAEAIGIEMTLREEYSGRGMYGKTTDAVIYENITDLLTCVATAVSDLKDAEDYATRTESEEVLELSPEDFIEALGSFRFDNMGRSSDIAY